jgi:hypothetical protein
VFGVYLTNEGSGAAFNVRFGVRLDGTEYPVGEGRGRRYLVPAGGRIPANEDQLLEVAVPIAPYALARGGRDVDTRAILYARYEDAFAHVWETRNPLDPLKDFTIGKRNLIVSFFSQNRDRNEGVSEMPGSLRGG